MLQRPGSAVARRPLHFIVIADCSGSMAADGKMRALNHAINETLPHLRSVASENPHAELLVRAVAFSTGAHWHVEDPTPVDRLRWHELTAGGYTDLGAALDLVNEQLADPVMEERSLPPALLLISDGMPTDDYRSALADLHASAWGANSVRMAVGIGREFDIAVLREFIADPGVEPMQATNPEQLVSLIRWASIHVSQSASNAAPPTPRIGPVAVDRVPSSSELVW